jgi:hypothetical protein
MVALAAHLSNISHQATKQNTTRHSEPCYYEL